MIGHFIASTDTVNVFLLKIKYRTFGEQSVLEIAGGKSNFIDQRMSIMLTQVNCRIFTV